MVTITDEHGTEATRRMSGYIDAGGVHTYYEVRGPGDPVVMLHGGFASVALYVALRRPRASPAITSFSFH